MDSRIKKEEPLTKPPEAGAKANTAKRPPVKGNSALETRLDELEELESLRQRNIFLYAGALVLSVISAVILATWVFGSRGPVSSPWVLVDIVLSIALAIGFFTRSGFRQGGIRYIGTHFFDFIAIVPALVLVHHGYVFENPGVWVILVARTVRAVDRLLGDGFVRRNTLALVEGLEEEITDRVLERIVARIQADMDQAEFTRGVAEALVRNKTAVLQRVRAATPHQGFIPGLAHMVGLDTALERAEDRTYDAIVEIVNSKEVDRAVRDVVASFFSRIRNELGEKSWRKHLGIRR